VPGPDLDAGGRRPAADPAASRPENSRLASLLLLPPEIQPRLGRGRLLPTEETRREAWQWFRLSLFCVFDGIFVLDGGWASATTRWLVAIAATAVLLWDRGLWVRSRMRRHPAN
jgi:hypothetical protein